MKITLVRDDGKVKTLRTLKMELLLEQMKTEVKAQPVSKMREVLRYTLPGNSIEEVRKVPKVMPAAAFVRKEGVMTLNEYNGIVMMEVNNLSGRAEADEIKELVKELPQTYLAFTGSSGKSVKIWVRFTYPDDRLPTLREQAELFHAHAYQTAVKYYQPQLPFDIELKEPSLEQYCRLTYDPELYFNPKAMPIYMKQPVSLPSETTFIKRTRETDSPLQRMAPGRISGGRRSATATGVFGGALFSGRYPRRRYCAVDKGALPAPFGRVTDSRNCEKCLPFRQGIRQEEQSDGRTAFRHADGRIYEAPL